MPTEPTVVEQWYQMLTEGEPINRHLYHLYGLLPANPRWVIMSISLSGSHPWPTRTRSLLVTRLMLLPG